MLQRTMQTLLAAFIFNSGAAFSSQEVTMKGLPIRSAVKLQAAINASITARDPSYTIEEGAYYFDDGSPLLVHRAKQFELKGAGVVELWFRVTGKWKTGGVLMLECEDVTISGVSVDYDPPAYYQGTVLADAAKIGDLPSAAYVGTDQGFPDPYTYTAAHTKANDPSNDYTNSPAIWPKAIGYGCNRTMGCPGHGAGTLQPYSASLPKGRVLFAVLPSARKGDKITISIRKGITWHVQNCTNVTTRDVTVHGASMFGLSEFDGRGGHTWENVWLGRRQGLLEPETELCGRAPGRLCFGVLASNADAFHSSGCRRGPKLRNVTLSNNFDDFFNLHSRMQLVGKVISDTELIILDPRLQVAEGSPDDTPYGAAETMPNARVGMVLEFHALNTFLPLGRATIASLQRLDSAADIAAASATLNTDLDGRAPYHATPPYTGGSLLDVGQLCGAFSKQYNTPGCTSRVWKVQLSEPIPANVTQYSLSTLFDWDASEASVRDSHFFGGIDGVRWKSNRGDFSNNVVAATYMEITPLQYYLEGPAHLEHVTVENNTFTACSGLFGTARVNCSTGIPIWNNAGGFCRGNGGKGVEAAGTCDGTSMVVEKNRPATDCCFADGGAAHTCCSACYSGGRACGCCK